MCRYGTKLVWPASRAIGCVYIIVSTLARTIENGRLVAFVDFMCFAIWKRAHAMSFACYLARAISLGLLSDLPQN